MSNISLRPSRLDDSWHAFKGGSCIASGIYKHVLADAKLAQGPGEKVVRGGSVAMRFPPTEKQLAANLKTEAKAVAAGKAIKAEEREAAIEVGRIAAAKANAASAAKKDKAAKAKAARAAKAKAARAAKAKEAKANAAKANAAKANAAKDEEAEAPAE